MIGGQKIMLLREATTKRRNQLDHILGHSTTCSTFSTAFLNFISENYTVTLRIAQKGTEFVKDDPRLSTDKISEKQKQSQPSQPLTPGTVRKKSQGKLGRTSKRFRQQD